MNSENTDSFYLLLTIMMDHISAIGDHTRGEPQFSQNFPVLC